MPTVLVIDDEEGFLQIMQIILKRAGFATLAATNGEAGLDLAYEHHPDVIILDDMMPGMSGGDVCMQIKGDPDIANIAVIMYSAGAKVRNTAYIEQIGADGVMFKPSLPNEILDTVRGFIDAGV